MSWILCVRLIGSLSILDGRLLLVSLLYFEVPPVAPFDNPLLDMYINVVKQCDISIKLRFI